MISDEISHETDLLEAVKATLNRRGVASSVKAQLRAEVFHTLDDKTVELPEKPADVFISSELIREFLMQLNLRNTLSVFMEEIGQSNEMIPSRELISGELGINTLESDKNIPLLVQIVQYMMKAKGNTLRSSLQVERDDT
jgi:hypothetical protein